MICKYIHILPIYNLNGNMINTSIFNGIFKNRIDITKILNFRIINERSGDINDFNVLFDITENITNIIVPDNEFVYYSVIYFYMGLGLVNLTKFKTHIVSALDDYSSPSNISKIKLTQIIPTNLIYKEYIKSYYDAIKNKHFVEDITYEITGIRANITKDTSHRIMNEKRLKYYDIISYLDCYQSDYLYTRLIIMSTNPDRTCNIKFGSGEFNEYIEY